jgi:hypothetical protein
VLASKYKWWRLSASRAVSSNSKQQKFEVFNSRKWQTIWHTLQVPQMSSKIRSAEYRNSILVERLSCVNKDRFSSKKCRSNGDRDDRRVTKSILLQYNSTAHGDTHTRYLDRITQSGEKHTDKQTPGNHFKILNLLLQGLFSLEEVRDSSELARFRCSNRKNILTTTSIHNPSFLTYRHIKRSHDLKGCYCLSRLVDCEQLLSD